MLVLVTKASDDEWYEILNFDTMEDVQRFVEKCRRAIVVKKNHYSLISDDDIVRFWNGLNVKDVPTIKQCPLHIMIYDDYIE